MKLFSSALLLVVVILLKRSTGWVSCVEDDENLNIHPVVGVLFQELGTGMAQFLANGNVKWLQTAGALVVSVSALDVHSLFDLSQVPIWINQTNRYYHYVMNRINGVMFPGGGRSQLTSGYAKAADLILEIAMAKNDRGIHFPVWGSCQGFQKMVTYFSDNRNTNWITMCRTRSVILNLDFTPGLDLYRQTRMFAHGQQIVPILAKYPVTPNYHGYCLTTEDFYRMPNLSSNLILISSNTFNGTQFVTTIEHRKYPFFGTQWHPESPQFNGIGGKNSANTYRAILVAQYFANFFVNQTRRNHQHYRKGSEEEYESTIDNFNNYLQKNSYILPL